MPSPFPGMDPFIENQKWKGFHHSMISEIRNVLTPQVRPRYVVDVEVDVYLVKDSAASIKLVIPDVSVVHGSGWMENNSGLVATVPEPAILTDKTIVEWTTNRRNTVTYRHTMLP